MLTLCLTAFSSVLFCVFYGIISAILYLPVLRLKREINIQNERIRNLEVENSGDLLGGHRITKWNKAEKLIGYDANIPLLILKKKNEKWKGAFVGIKEIEDEED